MHESHRTQTWFHQGFEVFSYTPTVFFLSSLSHVIDENSSPLSIPPILTNAIYGCKWSKWINSFPSRQAGRQGDPSELYKVQIRQNRAARLTPSMCTFKSWALGVLFLLLVLIPACSGWPTFWAGGGFLKVCFYLLFNLLQLDTLAKMCKDVKVRIYWNKGQWKFFKVLHWAGLHRVGWSLPRPALQVSPKDLPCSSCLTWLALTPSVNPGISSSVLPTTRSQCSICFSLKDKTTSMLRFPRVVGKFPGELDAIAVHSPPEIENFIFPSSRAKARPWIH